MHRHGDHSSDTGSLLSFDNAYEYYMSMNDRNRRLLTFVFFFITLFSSLYIMSRVYKWCKIVKHKLSTHSFYLTPRCESLVLKLNQQLNYPSLAFWSSLVHRRDSDEAASNKKKKNKGEEMLDSLRFDYKESGNLNGVFQMDDELLIENETKQFDLSRGDSEDLTNSGTGSFEEIELNEMSSGHTKLKEYFETRRQNKMAYKKFDKTATKTKPPELSLWFKKKGKKSSYSTISSTSSIKLDSIDEASGSVPRKPRKKMMNRKRRSDTVSSASSVNTTFSTVSTISDLPTILITDTSSMNTIIVDLESKEDDRYYFN